VKSLPIANCQLPIANWRIGLKVVIVVGVKVRGVKVRGGKSL
jgi:hypothetical protein